MVNFVLQEFGKCIRGFLSSFWHPLHPGRNFHPLVASQLHENVWKGETIIPEHELFFAAFGDLWIDESVKVIQADKNDSEPRTNLRRCNSPAKRMPRTEVVKRIAQVLDRRARCFRGTIFYGLAF